jgi:hypothetical protein
MLRRVDLETQDGLVNKLNQLRALYLDSRKENLRLEEKILVLELSLQTGIPPGELCLDLPSGKVMRRPAPSEEKTE